MTISNQVLKTLLNLSKYNNGEWKSEKQKDFLIKILEKNGNRFFSNTVVYSDIFFIFEYNELGITKITKETQGLHRRDSQIKLSFFEYWVKLDQKENEINNKKLKEQQIKKIKRNIIVKNINKYKEIIMSLYKNLFIDSLNKVVMKPEIKEMLIDRYNGYSYYDICYFIEEGLKTNPDNIELKRIKKLVEKIEEKNKKIESLF